MEANRSKKKRERQKKINKEKLVEMEKSEKQNIAAGERQKLNTGEFQTLKRYWKEEWQRWREERLKGFVDDLPAEKENNKIESLRGVKIEDDFDLFRIKAEICVQKKFEIWFWKNQFFSSLFFLFSSGLWFRWRAQNLLIYLFSITQEIQFQHFFFCHSAKSTLNEMMRFPYIIHCYRILTFDVTFSLLKNAGILRTTLLLRLSFSLLQSSSFLHQNYSHWTSLRWLNNETTSPLSWTST